jgi:hypothetical protein
MSISRRRADSKEIKIEKRRKFFWQLNCCGAGTINSLAEIVEQTLEKHPIYMAMN